ncbi:pentapeptide repeat-containing protein [Actinoplanes oblitus]|uniref:Pentapeptide repeat-containing protein n=1 Tax=Actinoplanes oblitus TaxID=3040509 RepID=A0ABY8WRY0_9ACTN|nr:pentapeptide repeat-containing protein [Actinoplanes oblitus]WIM99605.1 pentapeptide repeat-containing protein [Actinoplanes oblitus]
MTVKITRDGQLTSRFGAAVEQLGSDQPVTSMGAVHALQRLALDSPKDRPAIIDLLADYVRLKIGIGSADHQRCYAMRAPTVDVMAALRVLVYTIGPKLRDHRVDLREICLRKVELLRADLTCMLLDNTVLDSVRLAGAHFAGASLENAEMRGDFQGADFSGAVAWNAKFGGTPTLDASVMNGATFHGTDLTGASLVEVDLTRADFTNAKLTSADFHKSVLDGATLKTYLNDVPYLPHGADRTKELGAPPTPAADSCPHS